MGPSQHPIGWSQPNHWPPTPSHSIKWSLRSSASGDSPMTSGGLQQLATQQPSIYSRLIGWWNPFLTKELLQKPDHHLCNNCLDMLVSVQQYFNYPNCLDLTGYRCRYSPYIFCLSDHMTVTQNRVNQSLLLKTGPTKALPKREVPRGHEGRVATCNTNSWKCGWEMLKMFQIPPKKTSDSWFISSSLLHLRLLNTTSLPLPPCLRTGVFSATFSGTTDGAFCGGDWTSAWA